MRSRRLLVVLSVAALLAAPARAALAAPAAAPAAAVATPVGGACARDSECVSGSICDQHLCTALVADRTIIPFYFFKSATNWGHRYIIPLLYFSKRSGGRTTRVAFPWFVYTRDQQQDLRNLQILSFLNAVPGEHEVGITPLFWRSTYGPDGRDGSNTAFLPFFAVKKHASRSSVILPLLLSGTRGDSAEDWRQTVIAGVGYYGRHGSDVWRVLFPLWFDHESKDTRTIVAPLTWYKRTPAGSAGVAFPLFWHSASQATGRSNTLLLPFYNYQTADHGRRATLASLLAFYQRDDDQRMRQLFLVAPLAYHRNDDKRAVTVVPPLFARWTVKDDGSQGTIAGPFYHSTDIEGSTSVLFPIYWRFRDRASDASTQLILPVAGLYQRPGAFGTFIGPTYLWHSQGPGGGFGAGLFPLIFFGKNGASHHALVLPIFAHVSGAHGSTTAVGPLFYRHTHDGWDAGALPLLWAGRHGSSSYGGLLPIFWHRGDARGSTQVLGPLWLTHGPQRFGLGIFPVLSLRWDEQAHTSHQSLLPIFFRTTDGDRTRMLAGPWYHRSDGDAKLDIVVPLLYYRRDARRALLLSPIAGWERTADRRDTVVVGPYVHRADPLRHATTHLLLPLGAIHREPGYEVTVQFPFFWRIKEGDETDTTIFPFFWRIRSPRTRADVVFPLAGRVTTQTARTTVVGPVYDRARTDGGRAFGVFPLFAWGKKAQAGGDQHYLFAPLVYHQSDDKEHRGDTWAALFFRFVRGGDSTNVLFPLGAAWRRGTSSRVALPLFYHQSDHAAGSALSVLGPFYWGHTSLGPRFGLAPLFFFNGGSADIKSATLLPLFYFNRRPGGSTLLTPAFGYSTRPTGHRFYVGTFYRRNDAGVQSTALWPLFYDTKDEVTDTRTSLLLPLFFNTRNRDGREISAYTPLVWRYRSVEGHRIVGLPLFFYVHNFAESTTTGLLPFFVINKSQAFKATTVVVPPLLTFFRHRGGDRPGNDFALFPLIWHFGGQNHTSVVFPLFWDMQRGPSRTTVVAPIFAHWRRPDGIHTYAVNTYYRKGVGPREGSYYLNVFPFFDVGRPRPQDIQWNVVEGLFGYSRLGRNRSVRILWLLDFSLEPAPIEGQSWFTSTAPAARESGF